LDVVLRRRRVCALGFLCAVGMAVSLSAAPACGVFGGCDEEGVTECGGDDTVRLCQRDCTMRGTPDESCSEDFSWTTLTCEGNTACRTDPGGRPGCVVEGTRSCPVVALPGHSGSVLAADVDKNGTSDLVVLGPQRISVDLGGGKIVVTDVVGEDVRRSIPTSAMPQPAIGDFDGDGRVDLAWLDVDTTPVVALGDGFGAFRFAARATESILEGTLLAAADFDGDRKSDLVVSTRRGEVYVAFAQGDGRFARGPETRLTEASEPGAAGPPPPPFDVYAAADFDGDGLVDLLLQNGALVGGRSDGRFVELGVLPRASLRGLLSSGLTRVADVDGDGDIDIVTTDYLDSRLLAGVFLNDGKGGFERVSACVADPRAPGCVVLENQEADLRAIVDLDGDGRVDLVASKDARSFAAGPHTLRVRLGRGDGTFGELGSFWVPAAPRSFAVHEGRLVVGSDAEGAVFAVPRSCL
jgi:hypothetical protein